MRGAAPRGLPTLGQFISLGQGLRCRQSWWGTTTAAANPMSPRPRCTEAKPASPPPPAPTGAPRRRGPAAKCGPPPAAPGPANAGPARGPPRSQSPAHPTQWGACRRGLPHACRGGTLKRTIVSDPRLLGDASLVRFCRGPIPVKDLLAGPKQRILRGPNVFDHVAKVFKAVRCPHDIGMDDDGHHARGVSGVAAQLFELVDRAIVIFRRLMVLD